MSFMTLSAVVTSLVFFPVITLTSVNSVQADDTHQREIDIISWSGVDIHKESSSADKSSIAVVEVKNSLSLQIEQGERPSIDREHTITFGDGEHGKRPSETTSGDGVHGQGSTNPRGQLR